jgi:predicted permease
MIATLRSVPTLRRHWKLAAISAFSLSIAMALAILGLSIANAVLLLPPAAPAPDRLVMIYDRSDTNAVGQVSYPDYQYYRKNNHVFADLAAAPNSLDGLSDFNFGGRQVNLFARSVSDNYFTVLGIRPYLGRLFLPGDDESATRIAVMTYSCWKRLGADPNLVGKVLAGKRIVGVTPKDFTGAFFGLEGDLFTTIDGGPWQTQRTARQLSLLARLKPGVTRRQANAEVATLAGQLASAYPRENNGRTAVVTRATLLPPDAIPTAELMSGILMALVLLVLLIACANVANLLLAVAVGRRQETAIKLALGAPRARLVREFLAESAVLCSTSGVVGYSIATAAVARYSNFTVVLPAAGAFSIGVPLRMDATVTVLAILLMAIATVATGLAPALNASSPGIASILSRDSIAGGTRKRTITNTTLVIVQVAICTLVLIGMGLCQRNLRNLRNVDLGFGARNLIANTVYLEGEGYNEARGKELYGTLRRTLSALPGVESVTLAGYLPLLGASQLQVQFPDASKTIAIARNVVDKDYFSTFELKIVAGRAFNSSDRENSPTVAIVNRKMADTFWPGRDAVGMVIMAGKPAQRVIVVGVAADSKYRDLDEPTQPFIYYALSQHYQGAINVIARVNSSPRMWIEPFAQSLRGLGLQIQIQPITLENWMTLTLLRQRVAAGFVTSLSALALLLAIVGLWGAISYSVSQRKKELGIRVALGALPWELLNMVLRQTMTVAGVGVGIGTLLGVGATVVFRPQLYGIGVVEWRVLAPVGLAMLLLSLLVASLSARPWIHVDPMETMRHH